VEEIIPLVRYMTRIGRCLLALMLAGSCLAAPGFKAPMKAGAPFRRDRLPIDPDRMSALSEGLTIMAAECGRNSTPGNLRAASQLLALAHALRPSNPDVIELVRQLSEGNPPESPAGKRLSHARSMAWKQGVWLASSQAGPDANLLAACLGDALAVADPDHPHAATLRDRGEQGPWDNWVPPPEAFGGGPERQPKPGGDAPLNPGPGGKDPSQAGIPFKLKTVQVMVPMWVYDKDSRTSGFKIEPLAIKAWNEPMPQRGEEDRKDDGEERPQPQAMPEYYVGFRSEKLDAALRPTFDSAREAVTIRQGGLPMRGRGHLSVPGGGSYHWGLNRDSAGAAIALLMDATITGSAPGGAVIVLGSIGPGGTFEPSWRLWDRLRRMAEDDSLPGGRLILPRQAAPLLKALLVLNKPDFFLRYEVLLAGSLTELAGRAVAEPVGKQQTAAEEFAQVRTASKDQLIGPYLANRFVRERFNNILKSFPDHASARTALLQGSGERPTTYTTPILAAELRHAISPMDWLPRTLNNEDYHNFDKDFSLERLARMWKSCRERLDQIENLTARSDQELWEDGFELVQSIRTLSNTLRRISNGGGEYKYKQSARKKAGAELAKQYAAFHQQLLKLSGEIKIPPDKGNSKRNSGAAARQRPGRFR